MITDIRLQNFRSYGDESFEVGPGVTIVVGPNASGKTNLLEAIMLSCIGRSYRAKDSELIAYEKPWSRIDTHTPTETRIVKLERAHELTNVHKSFELDDQVFKRMSLQKSIPIVLFEPNHLQILSGSPDGRRGFIDELLEQTVTGYSSFLRQYKRTLAQRNALLKKGKLDTQLFAWNIRLSELGSQIANQRMRLVASFNESISELYSQLAHKKSLVTLEYATSCHQKTYASDMLHKLERTIDRDLLTGHTSYGPHRDDIAVLLNGHILQESASRGEARTMMLALKILEMKLMKEARGQSPILLLDDVFSELDGARRKALTEFLVDHQTFITTTDADVVVQHFMDKCNVIPLGK